MNYNALDSSAFFSLLPIILISIGLLALMMVIAIRRDAKLSFQIALTTLAVTFISLFIISDLLPQQATPLLLIDSYGLFFMGLILIASILLLPLCHDYWEHHQQIQDEFYLLYLISILGALVLISSSHFAALFLGLELLSLPIIIMVGYPFFSHYSASMESATKYLILSAAASATLMFGIALIYSQYGTLEFIPLTETIASQAHAPHILIKVGIAMLLIGIAFKLSLVPFHLWTPDVYQGAPLPATAFLATISKGAVFALFLRFYLSSEMFLTESLVWSIATVAVASMLVGNLLALFQESIKRLLAYSSIAHFGYLLVALLAISQSFGADIAIEAVAYYLVAYLLSTLAAFAVLMRLPGLKESTDAPRLDNLSGLFWSHPVLAIILTLAMLSLAGIPLTVGFIGKFYIFAAAVEESLWGILLVAVIGSGIGLFYYLRVILVMTYSVCHKDTESYLHPGQGGRVVLSIVALLTLWLGIYPAPLIELIREMTLRVF